MACSAALFPAALLLLAGAAHAGDAMCSWGGRCSVNNAWASTVLARLSPELKKYAELDVTCGAQGTSDQCIAQNGCQWDAANNGCGAVGTAKASSVWTGSRQTCGFVADMSQALACESLSAEECASNQTCTLDSNAYTVVQNSTMGANMQCSQTPKCKSAKDKGEIMAQALCGEQYNLSAAMEGCGSQAAASTNTTNSSTAAADGAAAGPDPYTDCMRQSCAAVGELLQANTQHQCSAKTRQECGQGCMWSESGCGPDVLEVLRNKIPDGCPVKEAALSDDACGHNTAKEACTGNCRWTALVSCNSTGQVDSEGECTLKDSVFFRTVASSHGDSQAELMAQLAEAKETCATATTEQACTSAAAPTAAAAPTGAAPPNNSSTPTNVSSDEAAIERSHTQVVLP